MEIIVLGSSGSIPTKNRGLPSIALKYEGETFLFDCGEGTQRQIQIYNLNPSKISAIFLSHLHLDHCLGVYGILESANLLKREKTIKIFGPKGTKNFFKHYKLAEIYEIERDKKILETQKYSISTFKLNHGPTNSFGYIFEEKEKVRFYEQKAKKVGICGVLFSKIQEKKKLKVKNKTIKLSDISYIEKGRKIVFIGDTLPIKKTEQKSKNADLLIHESTYLSDLKKEAKENFHTTAEQAAKIAKKAKVKKLLLFHLSQRYKNTEDFEKEAKKIFKNTFSARDGLKIKISKS